LTVSVEELKSINTESLLIIKLSTVSFRRGAADLTNLRRAVAFRGLVSIWAQL